ncbi:hypothetical protein I203_104141 [Kwoniella mangroviensis CBS 8507]|uniref:uncharacterized protein n=1 Tax=Kwoniella mangroviensis CBS 8507 TaxID=1296122 RepID=UPI00080D754A|nr:uncharacterized protein I203_00914 [Kwoniella mangroviensis CBS 8507]OCF70777.1 hypothetical protein I203_00914 [Kwoniella mangroviensis CBS 8507]
MIIPLDPPEAFYDLFEPFPLNLPAMPSTASRLSTIPRGLCSPTTSQMLFHIGPPTTPTNTLPKRPVLRKSATRRLKAICQRSNATPYNNPNFSSTARLTNQKEMERNLPEDPWAPRKHLKPEQEVVEMEDKIQEVLEISLTDRSGSTSRVQPTSHILQLTRSLSKLCGTFSPSTLFHTALKEIALDVGMKDHYPWYNYTISLDDVFTKALEKLLEPYDDVQNVSRYYHRIMNDQTLMGKYNPPDVLWVLVQTADQPILDSLYRIIKKRLDRCSNTQRGIVLVLLLKKVQETRWRKFKGWKSFAESVGLMYVQNGCVIDDSMGIPKLSADDIRLVIGVGGYGKRRREDYELEMDEETGRNKRKRLGSQWNAVSFEI